MIYTHCFGCSRQDGLVTASETLTQVGEGRGQIVLDAGAFSLGGSKTTRGEKALHREATKTTPERQAKWLIEKFHKDRRGVTLSQFDKTGTWDFRHARKILKERGINLTTEQEKAFIESEAKIFTDKLLKSKTNVSILYSR